MENTAYLSIGTNIGDRLENLKNAVAALALTDGVKVMRPSSVYETEPVGYTEQALFLNMAVQLATSLSPEVLLDECLKIEEELGRVREFRWGPRIIDLDILLYNNEKVETEKLQIPHPRMAERAFVLVPLLELDGELELPGTNDRLAAMLDEIQDKEGVRLWKRIDGEDASALSGS